MKKLSTFWQYVMVGGAGSVAAGASWYAWVSNLCDGVCAYSMFEFAALLSSGPLFIGIGMMASLGLWNLARTRHET